MPVLELVAMGWKSGAERRILITYVDSDGAPAIIGTNAGRDMDPAWVKNLRANPQARARWGGKWRDVTAVELAGPDHAAAWASGVKANAEYSQYRKDLTRPIPIFRLQEQ